MKQQDALFVTGILAGFGAIFAYFRLKTPQKQPNFTANERVVAIKTHRNVFVMPKTGDA